MLLFVLILLMNIIFFCAWLKMMFNNLYLKLRSLFMRRFCKARYLKAQLLEQQQSMAVVELDGGEKKGENKEEVGDGDGDKS